MTGLQISTRIWLDFQPSRPNSLAVNFEFPNWFLNFIMRETKEPNYNVLTTDYDTYTIGECYNLYLVLYNLSIKIKS